MAATRPEAEGALCCTSAALGASTTLLVGEAEEIGEGAFCWQAWMVT